MPDPPLPERRRAARRCPARDEALSQLRLRIGPQLAVVNVGDTGALVEGAARLGPGARVDVHVITRHGRVLVRTTVTRARVCAVRADAITFQAALRFDGPIDARPIEARPPG